jgi:hypothetical protein
MGQPNPASPTDPATPPAGDPPTPPAEGTPPADPATDANPALKKALDEERAARKDMEKQLKALEPLKTLAASLGVKPDQGKTDVETLTAQVTAMQQQMRESELRAMRLEVAAEKGLTPAQAARLAGDSREALAKDADDLKALFPGTAAGANGQPGTPAPDPSQGARGGVNELTALLKAAQDKGDAKESIRLKQLINQQRRTT